MLPGNVLSLTPQPSAFLPPRDTVKTDPLTDLSIGGVALNDATQGLRVKTWTATYTGGAVVVSAPAVSPTTIITRAGITWLGLAFDQQMRIFLTWLEAAGAFYRWFDTQTSAFTISQLPVGSDRPFCQLDDARPLQSSSSDVILGYVRASHLYYRQQRDRYGVEYDLGSVGSQTFHQMGMNRTNRFQFQF